MRRMLMPFLAAPHAALAIGLALGQLPVRQHLTAGRALGDAIVRWFSAPDTGLILPASAAALLQAGGVAAAIFCVDFGRTGGAPRGSLVVAARWTRA